MYSQLEQPTGGKRFIVDLVYCVDTMSHWEESTAKYYPIVLDTHLASLVTIS